MKLNFYLIPYIKSIQNGFLNIRPKTIKLLEENIGERLHDICFGNNFMNVTPKTQATRTTTTTKVGLHQTKKLLPSKGNNQHNEKATYGMGENICKPYM